MKFRMEVICVTDNNSDSYVSGATYAPFGGLTSMVNGKASGFSGITVSNSYNNRLQPSVLSAATSTATVFSLGYSFSNGTANNGNVYQIQNNLNNSRNQTFTFDSLNRISTAASQATTGQYCWGQIYGYYSGQTLISGIDAWGNLNQINPSKCSSSSLSQAPNYKNQFTGFCYDAAGNLLDETSCPVSNHAFTYDAEGRLIYTAGDSYIYDGDGNRAIKCTSNGQSNTCPSGSTGKLYWRDTGGNTLVESNLSTAYQSEYVYFNGNKVARFDSSKNIHYYFTDHLTSTRVVTNATGMTPPEQDVDLTPYGSVADGSPTEYYLFTGQERDGESTLDYFNARHYTSALGRFMVPDPSGLDSADPSNPQSLNFYSYVLNNPLSFIDPTGLDCVYLDDTGNFVGSVDHDSNKEECQGKNGENGGYWVPGYVCPNCITNIDSETNTIAATSWDRNTGFSSDWQSGSGNTGWGNWFGQPNDLVQTQDSDLPYDQAAMLAIHGSFAKFPNICSVTFSLNAGFPKDDNWRVGAEYNTEKGLALRGRFQVSKGPATLRLTTKTSGGVSGSVRVGGTYDWSYSGLFRKQNNLRRHER